MERDGLLSLVIAVRDDQRLQAALERWTRDEAVGEIVVVDFGSASPLTGRGVLGLAKTIVVRVGADEPWAKGLALNVGIEAAAGAVILAVDCGAALRDTGRYRRTLEMRGGYLSGYGSDKASSSEIAMFRREDWQAVGGYHEYLLGWGFEDEDLFNRLEDAGGVHRFFQAADFGVAEPAAETAMAGSDLGIALPDRLESHRWFQINRNKILAGLAPWNGAMAKLRPRRFGRPAERVVTCELAPRTRLERRLQDCASFLAARFLHNVAESVAFPMLAGMIDERHGDYAARAGRQLQIDKAVDARGRQVRTD